MDFFLCFGLFSTYVHLDFQNMLSATGPPGGPMGLATTVGHPGLLEYLSAVYTPNKYIHNGTCMHNRFLLQVTARM